MKKKLLINIIITTTILISIMGCTNIKEMAKTASHSISNPSQNSKASTSSSSKITINNLTVFGDSLAKGTGDENNQGFAGLLATEFFKPEKGEVKLTNLAINGLTSTQLIEQLSGKENNETIANSDLIILSIGGNDLMTLMYTDKAHIVENFIGISKTYTKNLKDTITYLRGINNNCPIMFLGLYDIDNGNLSASQRALLQGWNSISQNIIESDSKSIFIPTFDLFKSNYSNFISSDALHPNSAGYRAISELMNKSINEYFNK